MQKHEVLYDNLPGIGDLFELPTESEFTIVVVTHNTGRRELALGRPGDDQPFVTVPLTETEALVLANLLTGTQIELTPTSRSWPSKG